MKSANKVNNDGFIVETVMVEDDFQTKDNVIIEHTTGLYKPKWDFVNKKWTEGLSQEEIDIIKNTPLPKTELEIAQETINSLGTQLFEAQTQILQAESDKVTLGQQLFSLQTQLMTKGVL